ncbi:MAG: hypothetical protein KC583_20255 [Myxococcales bacterium]|nr:hypothetical protein [Myxococcales bacterium]MCA9560897.1 hypothetical protein [Myxococcales bacterium]
MSLVQHAVDLAAAAKGDGPAHDAAAQAESERAEAIAEAGGNPFPDLPALAAWRPK